METIGLIGVGKIGSEIAKHLLGCGYGVLGHRRSSLAQFESLDGVALNLPIGQAFFPLWHEVPSMLTIVPGFTGELRDVDDAHGRYPRQGA